MLILFSSPQFIAEEIPAITALFEAGVTHFHLRKPQSNEENLAQFIQQIPIKYHNKIILHQHHVLNKHFSIKGLHFNSFQQIVPTTNYGTLSLSQSVHHFQEIDLLDARIHYAFLSPIFDSISKKNYPAAFTEKALIDFFAAYQGNAKIIALGGINAANIAKVKKLGFAGAAILGDLWTQFEVDTNIVALVQRYQMLQQFS